MSFNILIHFAKALRDLEGRPEEEEQFKKILSSLEAKRISKQKNMLLFGFLDHKDDR